MGDIVNANLDRATTDGLANRYQSAIKVSSAQEFNDKIATRVA
jgi:hypothetical protein